eukprot:TRINITY_DN20200_c0_g1_i1.p1 TRINITY_DN20200_c0_g1~~TRINITY_DN20200_c0_g1_i1.p1  ORF type:complete len:636 (+),score=106.37 TRINITY_DN20200_c0_g1_i1:155-1909(+)
MSAIMMDCFKQVMYFLSTAEVLGVLLMQGSLQRVVDNISKFCIKCAAQPITDLVSGDENREQLLLISFTLGLNIMMFCSQTYDLIATEPLSKDAQILIDSCLNFSTKSNRQVDLQKLDNIFNQFRSRPEKPYQNCRSFPPLDVILCTAHRILPGIFNNTSPRGDNSEKVRYFQQLVHEVPYTTTAMFLPLCVKLEESLNEPKPDTSVILANLQVMDKMIEALKDFESHYRLIYDIIIFQLFKVVTKQHDGGAILRKMPSLSHFPKYKNFLLQQDRDRTKTLWMHLEAIIDHFRQVTWSTTLTDHRPLRAPVFTIYRVCFHELGPSKFLEVVLSVLFEACGVSFSRSSQEKEGKSSSKRSRNPRSRTRAHRIGETFGWIAAYFGGTEMLELVFKSISGDSKKALVSANSEKSGKALAMFLFTFLSKLQSGFNSKDLEMVRNIWRFLGEELKVLAEKRSKAPPSVSSFVLCSLSLFGCCGKHGLFHRSFLKECKHPSNSMQRTTEPSLEKTSAEEHHSQAIGLPAPRVNRISSISLSTMTLSLTVLREEMIENLLILDEQSIALSFIDLGRIEDVLLFMQVFTRNK